MPGAIRLFLVRFSGSEKTRSDDRLDVRYATTNNLFGTVSYSEPRAFLQRPAAAALIRINSKLRKMGYVLLVHDAYRPWYVTKVFWEATPSDKKLFVADPSKGSRHNRGAAVDLTLYDLKIRNPSKWSVLMTILLTGHTPTILAALHSSVGTAICYVHRWKLTALQFTRPSGGTSTIMTGRSTPSEMIRSNISPFMLT